MSRSSKDAKAREEELLADFEVVREETVDRPAYGDWYVFPSCVESGYVNCRFSNTGACHTHAGREA